MGESRSEDIMENILGAGNDLEAAQSRTEAILQSILYGTEYQDDAQSRVEALLLRLSEAGGVKTMADVETGEDYILIPSGVWMDGIKLLFSENWEWSPFNFNRDILIQKA